MKNNIKKEFIWNSLGSGLTSFCSLFFLIIANRINGINIAGTFNFCYATICIFYCIAVYCGRTYQVTETDKNISNNDYIKSRIISTLLMLFITIVFAVINRYDFIKFSIFIILALMKIIEAISDVYHGILQKNNRLDIVGKSLFIRSILDILVFFIIEYFTKNIILASLSMVIISLIIFIFIDKKNANKYIIAEKYSKSSIIKIFKYGFFAFAFTFIANYLVNAPRYAIDSLMSSKFQTIFGIIVMPASIIMLINQLIIQPLIMKLKNYYKNKDKNNFVKIILILCIITTIIGVFSMIIAYFIGIPILNLLYGIDLTAYKTNLIIVLVGATLYTLSTILSNALIVLRKTKVQMIFYATSFIFAIGISYYLVDLYKFNGAIYSYILIMLLLFIMYLIYFIAIIYSKKVWSDKK